MLVYSSHIFIEQGCHLFLGQPDSFFLQMHFKLGLPIIGLINYYFAVFCLHEIHKSTGSCPVSVIVS